MCTCFRKLDMQLNLTLQCIQYLAEFEGDQQSKNCITLWKCTHPRLGHRHWFVVEKLDGLWDQHWGTLHVAWSCNFSNCSQRTNRTPLMWRNMTVAISNVLWLLSHRSAKLLSADFHRRANRVLLRNHPCSALPHVGQPLRGEEEIKPPLNLVSSPLPLRVTCNNSAVSTIFKCAHCMYTYVQSMQSQNTVHRAQER